MQDYFKGSLVLKHKNVHQNTVKKKVKRITFYQSEENNVNHLKMYKST